MLDIYYKFTFTLCFSQQLSDFIIFTNLKPVLLLRTFAVPNSIMNVTIDPDSGFCFGVVYAIEIAERELAKSDKLYCLVILFITIWR